MDDVDKELDELLREEAALNGQLGAENQNQAGEGASLKNLPRGVRKRIWEINEGRRTAEEEVARLRTENAELKKPKQPEPTSPVTPPTKDDDIEARVELRLQGYTPDQIAFIKRNQQPGQALADAAKDPFVVAAIAADRAKTQVANATPAPSQRTGVTVPEKKRPKDWTPAERRQYQEQRIAEKRRQQGIDR